MRRIETERLVLRELTVEDAAFVCELVNEPSFIKHIGDRGVRTLEEARQYILDGPVASYERHGFGSYLVELKASGVPIGLNGMLKREALEDVDIGYAFQPAFWSRGYALESSIAVLEHARTNLGLDRIVAVVSPGNERSIRLLEKLGLRFERMVRLTEDEPAVQLYGCAL